jgi:hypothetical protein
MSITRTTNTASNGTREAVLAALASDTAMTSAQVADTAGIGRSTATRSLASLAADGLVTAAARPVGPSRHVRHADGDHPAPAHSEAHYEVGSGGKRLVRGDGRGPIELR